MPLRFVRIDQQHADFIDQCIAAGAFTTTNEVVSTAPSLMARCAHDLAQELAPQDEPPQNDSERRAPPHAFIATIRSLRFEDEHEE